MNNEIKWCRKAWLVALYLATTVGGFVPVADAATGSTNGVTITSINLYAGTGALVFFSPANPGMGSCANSAGNAVWVDWSSQVLPDGKALYTSLYANYLAGKTVGLNTSGCTSDGYYPVVSAFTL